MEQGAQEQRQRDRRNHQRQHAVLEHGIDDEKLEHEAEDDDRQRDRDQRRQPERRAEIHRRQHEEGRQHDELALGEVDRLRGLPQQGEADGDEGVDRPGRQSGHQELNERSHRTPAVRARPASPPPGTRKLPLSYTNQIGYI